MSILAILLLAVGLGDLARSALTPEPSGRGRLLAGRVGLAIGWLTVVLGGVLADLRTLPDLLLLLLAGVIMSAWILLSVRAGRRARGQAAPLTALGGGLLVMLLLSGAASPASGGVARWLQWNPLPGLHDLTPDRFLLVLGLLATQLSTGNEVVRLVLASVGALKPQGQPQASDSLRGGRLLGPMERVFILGLGLAGQPTAAGLVIAAKGLIRFPELNARRSARQEVSGVGIDEVTEYFLVGSFVSWLVSLSALGLALLA